MCDEKCDISTGIKMEPPRRLIYLRVMVTVEVEDWDCFWFVSQKETEKI